MGVKLGLLTLREEHRLRVFENRVLRIFGPMRDEVMGEWRKLHNEELHDFGLAQDRDNCWETIEWLHNWWPLT
jgi:hypothetical protein